MPGDDLTQLSGLINDMRHEEKSSDDIARAITASGLVVPTGDVLNLAQQWENQRSRFGHLEVTGAAAELRALTQQKED